ncbi:ORF108 [Plodia interpunctella granulovirus]|uniref:ORF108 n=1 Tax=Plodia interpunctella granulovirus TaxID=262175 RepID=A0A1L5JGT0_9BBAC|nr:ORF108 [Plodia interpunctella granulovirus]APO13992.1 ORF108 [Plodia interpunctella granulovirus]
MGFCCNSCFDKIAITELEQGDWDNDDEETRKRKCCCVCKCLLITVVIVGILLLGPMLYVVINKYS